MAVGSIFGADTPEFIAQLKAANEMDLSARDRHPLSEK